MVLPILFVLYPESRRNTSGRSGWSQLCLTERPAGDRIPPLQWRKSKLLLQGHTSGLYTLPAGRTETLAGPHSGQESQSTNKRLYLAAGYFSHRRALPQIMSSICPLARKRHRRKHHPSPFAPLLLRKPETSPGSSASPSHPVLLTLPLASHQARQARVHKQSNNYCAASSSTSRFILLAQPCTMLLFYFFFNSYCKVVVGSCMLKRRWGNLHSPCHLLSPGTASSTAAIVQKSNKWLIAPINTSQQNNTSIAAHPILSGALHIGTLNDFSPRQQTNSNVEGREESRCTQCPTTKREAAPFAQCFC